MSEENEPAQHEHSHEHHDHEAHHETHHAAHEHSESHEHSHAERKKRNEKILYTVGAILVFVIIAAIVLSSGGKGGGAATATPTPAASAVPLGSKIDVEALKVKLKNFLDVNFLVEQKLSAEIKSVTEKNGVFEVETDIMSGGTKTDSALVYVTLDGQKIILGNAMDLVAVSPVPSPTPAPKTDNPDVKLFVMSMCPYGTTAEYAMIPVIKLLGDKASFDIRFIATATGNNSFDSLHGEPEVQENMRQACIAANQKDKYLAYLECFVKAPAEAINANDAAAYQAINWTQMAVDCMKTAKVDEPKVKECMTGTQGTELLKNNIALANELGIGSSPTITINGDDYAGARSSEAFKTGVCDAFKTAPAECSQQLSNASGTSSNIGCGS